MTPALILLVYYAGLAVVATYLLSDPVELAVLALRIGSRRHNLVAWVAGVMWPILALCFAAGLVWYAFTADRSDHQWV